MSVMGATKMPEYSFSIQLGLSSRPLVMKLYGIFNSFPGEWSLYNFPYELPLHSTVSGLKHGWNLKLNTQLDTRSDPTIDQNSDYKSSVTRDFLAATRNVCLFMSNLFLTPLAREVLIAWSFLPTNVSVTVIALSCHAPWVRQRLIVFIDIYKSLINLLRKDWFFADQIMMVLGGQVTPSCLCDPTQLFHLAPPI